MVEVVDDAGVVVVDGEDVVDDDDVEVVVLAADKEFKLLARNALNEHCAATPAVANHRLYVRTESTLFCIGQPAP